MTLTIYFSGSITGGREDVGRYREIVAALEGAGHRVLASAVTQEHVGAAGEPLSREAIFSRDLRWLDEADLLVAEVSKPSLGVGYEIAYARHGRGIPVVCLFRPAFSGRCSAMIAGDPGIRLIEYEEAGVATMLDQLRESLRLTSRSTGRLP